LTFGRPQADFPAAIRIHSESLESDLSATSDKPSSVTFPNLPPGQYLVAVTAPSRDPAEVEISLAAGQSARLSLIVDRVFPLTLSFSAGAASVSNAVPQPDASAALIVPGATPATAAPPTVPSTNAPADPTDPPDISPSPSPSGDAPSKLQPFVSPCAVDDVIPRVSANVQEFVDSINRIAAVEWMNFERRNSKGRLEEKAQNKVNYVAVIQPIENGFLSVDEYRNGSPGMSGFPGHIASTGSIALALIFHPTHVNEFSMSCKGLLAWHDVPAYEVTFQQRLDQPNTMSEFRTSRMTFPILLKGTAFVDAETFQIVHLETDLLKPIPEVFLDVEHQAIDYGPVAFEAHHDRLWLPRASDITVHFHNKQFNERHSYTDYRVFTVDTGQKISKPNMPRDANALTPN
jgi:hypothetical protein